MIRYGYRPYHPWRHGYRRERAVKVFFIAVRLLFAAECLYFAGSYLSAHAVRRTETEQVLDGEEAKGKEVYGIGIEEKDGEFFWFHSRSFEESDPPIP